MTSTVIPRPSYVVVDANVSLKWLFNDEETLAQAGAIRDETLRSGGVLVVPSPWIYEVMNGLATGVRRNRLTEGEGLGAIRRLLAFPVSTLDAEPVVVSTRAFRFGITAYDAAYVALAVGLDAPLWTNDRPLHQTMSPHLPNVQWIGDYRCQEQ